MEIYNVWQLTLIYNLQTSKVREQLTEKAFSKQQAQIDKLNEVVGQRDREKEEIKEKYAIDNQIKLLFPNYYPILGTVMNVLLKLEDVKDRKTEPSPKKWICSMGYVWYLLYAIPQKAIDSLKIRFQW